PRHSKNVLSGSKKRCKLLIRCGREKLLRITVSTFSSPKRSTLLSPFQSRILPSWSVEGRKENASLSRQICRRVQSLRLRKRGTRSGETQSTPPTLRKSGPIF